MNEQNIQLSQRIDQYIISHIGQDSPLYGKLNFDQREVIKTVYKICDTYVMLLNEGVKQSESLADRKPGPLEKPTERLYILALSIPVLLASIGAFVGNFLEPQALMTPLCGIACGAAGVFAMYMMQKSKHIEKRLPSPAAEKPAVACEEAVLEQITEATNELLEYVGKLSRPKETGYDIRSDYHFAKWVQKVMSAVWKEDDKFLKVLVTDELDTRLSEMGLFVCTEPEFINGELSEPYNRLFTIRRKDDITEPKVTLPAICFGESALAKGELLIS